MIAILFVIINIICTILGVFYSTKRNKNFIIALLLSFVTSIFIQVSVYLNVNQWVVNEDWSALLDVIPTMKYIILGYWLIILIINIIATMNYYRNN